MSEKRQGFKECIEGLYDDLDIVSKAVLKLQQKEKQLQFDLAVYFTIIVVTNAFINYIF